MWSDREREYLEDSDAFVEKHGKNYEYKILHQIRHKFAAGIEDLMLLLDWRENRDIVMDDARTPGRPNKDLIFYFGFNALKCRKVAHDSLSPVKEEFLKSSDEEHQYMMAMLLKGTKLWEVLTQKEIEGGN